jgi:anti-sigma-K factor RskA
VTPASDSAARESERRAWIPGWAWAGGVVLLLLAAISTHQAHRMQQDLAAMRAQVEKQEQSRLALGAERETYEGALAILSASDTRTVHFKGLGMPEAAGMHAYWNPALGMLLTGQKLPPLSADRVLQLWVVPKKGAAVSAGVFRPDANGGVIWVLSPRGEMSAATELEITDEPGAGSGHPTTKPIWTGALR